MSENIEINFEILQGYYTKEELDNYIKNSILKSLNKEVIAYSSTDENIIRIPLFNIIRDIDIEIS